MEVFNTILGGALAGIGCVIAEHTTKKVYHIARRKLGMMTVEEHTRERILKWNGVINHEKSSKAR